jgi:hypothetical protein
VQGRRAGQPRRFVKFAQVVEVEELASKLTPSCRIDVITYDTVVLANATANTSLVVPTDSRGSLTTIEANVC